MKNVVHGPWNVPLNVVLAALVMWASVGQALAVDAEHLDLADQAMDRGIEYLLETQNEDGSWSPEIGPAITALCLTAILDHPRYDAQHPAARKAIDFILSHAQEDGLIHNGFLENYSTAISISALTRVKGSARVSEVVGKAVLALKVLQWDGQLDPQGNVVDGNHPFYGGAGYGRHGRPDLSNTHIMLQALHDAGLSSEDEAYQKALFFVMRCQGYPGNDLHGDVIVNDGGFIYATSINKDLIETPESKASPEQMDEAKTGAPVSGLRTYGSMTYAGFKSYLYADLPRTDPRVKLALQWIEQNWTLDRNPGMPQQIDQQGLFYMYLTLSKAMDASGLTYITTPDGEQHDWAQELIAKLASLQSEDGSWTNTGADRWMEDNPNLVTAYSLISLQRAVD